VPDAVAAIVIYGCAAVVVNVSILGIPVRHLQSFYVGTGSDPTAFIWYLAWWPHALRHGLNPFLTNFVWAPRGVNLAWQTSLPGVSIIAVPLTSVLGPVAAYNIVSLLSLPLSAFATYLLCRRLTRAFWPAIIAGLLFGFSGYEFQELSVGDLNLLLVFLIPTMLWLTILRDESVLSARNYTLLLSLALSLEFLMSTELFATTTLSGLLFALIGWLSAPRDSASRFQRIGVPALGAYVLSTLLVSPYLYYVIHDGMPQTLLHPGMVYLTSIARLFLPTPVSLVGGLPWSPWWFASGPGYEAAGCLSLPMLVVIGQFGKKNWHSPSGRILIFLVLSILAAVLGPTLRVFSKSFIPLPWWIATHVPLINQAVPARLTVYVVMIESVIAAMWLSSADVSKLTKRLVVFLAILVAVPNPSWPWTTPITTPQFFRSHLYRDYLDENETVLILPGKMSLLWQAESQLYFRMAGGPLGVAPPSDETPFGEPNVRLSDPSDRQGLKQFLRDHRVRDVIVADDTRWETFLSSVDDRPVTVGDVTLYRISGLSRR
jgi:hypothetical protein